MFYDFTIYFIVTSNPTHNGASINGILMISSGYWNITHRVISAKSIWLIIFGLLEWFMITTQVSLDYFSNLLAYFIKIQFICLLRKINSFDQRQGKVLQVQMIRIHPYQIKLVEQEINLLEG